MTKIELSEKEIQVIEKDLAGKIGAFSATEEEKVVMMGVLDKAEALFREKDPSDDELDGDLLKWFYGQYKAQGDEV